MEELLKDWLKFSLDVQPHCAAGEDWLLSLRAKTEAEIGVLNAACLGFHPKSAVALIKYAAQKTASAELLALIDEMLVKEREQIAAAWLRGNEQGWAMETDWPEHGFAYYDALFSRG